MFTGSIPKEAVEQITRIVDFSAWRKVFVGCSGSFRIEQAVKARHPGVEVFGNDVSLLTCSVGEAAMGRDFPLTFTGRLAFIEQLLEGRPFLDRVAAVVVALEMAVYKGKNEWAVSHFRHYETNFMRFLESARPSIATLVSTVKLDGFTPGDFVDQARRAKETSGGFVAAPPTYKGGYERIYKFLAENTEWPQPDYGIWNPKKLPEFLDELDGMAIRYCIVHDTAIEGRSPISVFRSSTNKPIYAYADQGLASVRGRNRTTEPFAYRPVDSARLTADSRIEILHASSAQMNFLKDKYLSKGINHVSGSWNYLVLVDGALAGGFIFSRAKWGSHGAIYLLSDFSIVREGRISKLVAMMTTSRAVIREIEIQLVQRFSRVFTTAFTKNAVSMKYRGIFELVSRKEGMLNYAGTVRDDDPQAIYAEWFRRFHRNDSRARSAPRPDAAGQERALHAAGAVQAPGGEPQA